MLFGAILALTCAFTWSLAIILFKKAGDGIHPVVLNLYKNLLGFFCLIPTVLLIEGPFPEIAWQPLAILLMSGFLGIGVADAMVLKALTLVGASRLAVLECVYSPFVIMLSVFFLGESLTVLRILGGAAVLGAILVVSSGHSKEALTTSREKRLQGVCWGIAGLFSMAVGIVAVKPVFTQVPLFWLIEIRMAAGVVASLVVFAALREKRALVASVIRAERRGLVFLACFLSTYVSMILWVSGYKYNDAAVTAVLNQTSTIFTVLLAALFLGERLTPKTVAGTVLAVTGVLILTLG